MIKFVLGNNLKPIKDYLDDNLSQWVKSEGFSFVALSNYFISEMKSLEIETTPEKLIELYEHSEKIIGENGIKKLKEWRLWPEETINKRAMIIKSSDDYPWSLYQERRVFPAIWKVGEEYMMLAKYEVGYRLHMIGSRIIRFIE